MLRCVLAYVTGNVSQPPYADVGGFRSFSKRWCNVAEGLSPSARIQQKEKAYYIGGSLRGVHSFHREVRSCSCIKELSPFVRCIESFKDKIKKEAPLRLKEVTAKASSSNHASGGRKSQGKQQPHTKGFLFC